MQKPSLSSILAAIGAAFAFTLAACGATDTSLGEHNGALGGERCSPVGSSRVADDGCNTCDCGEDGRWVCTDKACNTECTPGARRPAEDGCNTCTCDASGSWACTLVDCAPGCTPGATRAADDGCNTCTCTDTGDWACTERACPVCEEGETRPSGDGCNTCTCEDGLRWACSASPCNTECTPGQTKTADDGCNTCTCGPDGAWECTLKACLDCPPGEKRPASDGCNECTCTDTGQWICTQQPCSECTPGDEKPSTDGCNTCTCTESGWACTDAACTCTPGVSRPSEDGCNTCACTESGQWVCTARACAQCPPPGVSNTLVACDLVVWAKDPEAGTCCRYETNCGAPMGWPQYPSEAECSAAPSCPAPSVSDQACITVVAWAKDPATGACCMYGTPCSAPAGWEIFYNEADCAAK